MDVGNLSSWNRCPDDCMRICRTSNLCGNEINRIQKTKLKDDSAKSKLVLGIVKVSSSLDAFFFITKSI